MYIVDNREGNLSQAPFPKTNLKLCAMKAKLLMYRFMRKYNEMAIWLYHTKEII